MSLENLKKIEDLKTQLHDCNAKRTAKFAKMMQLEIDKIYKDFSDFFKNQGFDVSVNRNSLIASYKGITFSIAQNQYKTSPSKLSIFMDIESPKERFTFSTLNKRSQEAEQSESFEKEEEVILKIALKNCKDDVEGDISYTFTYFHETKRREFKTIEELLKSII